jgi:MFS family permease
MKIVTIFAGISGFLFGYDLGVITGALLMMKTAFDLTTTQEELVVSLVIAGSVIGFALPSYAISDSP